MPRSSATRLASPPQTKPQPVEPTVIQDKGSRRWYPVIDYSRCNKCWWVCSTFCPDGAIEVDEEGSPHIDYDHCKGCLVCVAKCPPHAIEAIPEHQAQEQEAVP